MKKVVVLLSILLLSGCGQSRENRVVLSSLDGLQTGFAPWNPEINQLELRLKAIGLPPLTTEGKALHTHQHLDLYLEGQKFEVPAGIGVGPNESYLASIHTHDTSGFIHVESPTVEDYCLGQFFDIWGVKFNDGCIGGYCNFGDKKLRVFSNGVEVSNSFSDIKLVSHQEIMVIYGTNGQMPKPILSSYQFPADY